MTDENYIMIDPPKMKTKSDALDNSVSGRCAGIFQWLRFDPDDDGC